MRIAWGKGKKEPASSRSAAEPAKGPEETAPPSSSSARSAPRPRPQTQTGLPTQRSLAQVLIDEGALSRAQLDEALAKQKAEGGFFVEILIEMGFISENSLTSFLAKQCKIPHLSLLDYLIDHDIVQLVPQELCLQYRLSPIDKMGRNLTVAMVNPLDNEALSKVQDQVPNLRIKPILCAYSHYQEVIGKVYAEANVDKGGVAEMSMTDLGLSPSSQMKPPKSDPPPAEQPADPEPPPTPEPEPAQPEPAPAEPLPEPEPEPAPEAGEAAEETVDGDSLLHAVMGDPTQDDAGTPVATAGDGPGDASSSIMQEMYDAMQNSMRDTYAVLARRIEVFRGLSAEEVAKVFASGMTVEFDAGETIFTKGDRSDELYVIISGRVDVMDGDRRIATLEAGDVVGEMAWVSDEPRSATAVARETSSLVTLSDEIFENLVSKEAAIQLLMNIILILTERIRRANET